ncbi:hypothetical protein SARC_12117 [Sphaeroforma arctica JP610]|uniref:MARVEL domain-containing protein n=1 Tax=Sphaeroforma arctica JP610 TaxID=667725 RepID=A0A0L0FFV5_9EUKA|nr:hypothetical protein SARC_12117 [Sphaeroforma arctica JP610]KNC75356.1 hypothetical protein SARC_12117 [Sphaeroforma arctica JP610]|eukprot:XP_014149258.1 hypothetical protein SARC_12117 [Sphaeroforma arctica JP610]
MPSDQEVLTPAQVRMLQVQQQLIQSQFQEQNKKKAEERAAHAISASSSNQGDMHGNERGDGQILENIPEDSASHAGQSHSNNLGEAQSTGLSQKNLAALPSTKPNKAAGVPQNGHMYNPHGLSASTSAINNSAVNVNATGMIPSESMHLYTDPRSTLHLNQGNGQGESQTTFIDPRLRGVPAESMHLFVDPRSVQNVSNTGGTNAHMYQQGYMQPIQSNQTLQLDPHTQAQLQSQILQNNVAAQRQGVPPPAAGYNSMYELGCNDNLPVDDVQKPKTNPLSPRTRKLYYSLAIVGFLFWVIGLVGVSGTTSYTSDLLGGYDVLSRNHLRMAWFSFWLFVFILFVTIIVVYLRGMNSSRALLMPVWTITILTLIIAADYALTLNDQLTFVPTNEGDLIQANNASYLSTTSNYIVVTYIGAILMVILSAFVLFLTACYDRTQFLR